MRGITAIKDKLNGLYMYFGGKKGIAVRAIAYPSLILLSHYGGNYLQGVIVDLCAESFYNMSGYGRRYKMEKSCENKL